MTIDFGPLRHSPATGTYAPSLPPAGRQPRAEGLPPRSRGDVDSVDLSIPASPPEDVLDAIAAAAQRAHELAEANRELHFHADELSGRIVVEVRDLTGNVIRTIPPSKALDVMAGLYGAERT